MSKHTPGPWVENDHTNNGGKLAVGPVNDAIDVCHVLNRDGVLNQRANACLIAAAPEMLEVLKKSLIQACRVGLDRHGLDYDMVAEMRKVIAKAEGRE